MRSQIYSKVFFFCSLFAIFFFLVSMTLTNVHIKKSHVLLANILYRGNDLTYDESDVYSDSLFSDNTSETINILVWTSPKTEPFVFLGTGQEGFKRRRCKYTNCFVTANRHHLKDVSQFDAVLFHGPEVRQMSQKYLPAVRSPHQKFIFASMESSHYYPMCSSLWDEYFNWTWTFRLDSNARWGYINIMDSSNKIIGPNKVMHWIKLEDMDPVSESFKERLKSKTRAAAWFVSNCNDLSGRKKFAKALQAELAKYNLQLDVYGKCGNKNCSRKNEMQCESLIDHFYYFYLAFENSFSEDYVTEKLLHALKYNAVPIVYGGANYSRFMPDGIYLDAKKLGVMKLAKKMHNLINDPQKYADYFKWQNHYSYHSREENSPDINEYCGFCKLLNNREKMEEITVIKNFHQWWDRPNYCP